MRKNHSRAGVSIALLALTNATWAATASTTFSVSARLVPTCTISANALSFGNSIPTPIASNIDAQTTINALCSNNAAYTVALNRGIGPAATFGSRKLTNGANTINYTLYRNAAHTQIWGDGSGASSVASGIGTGSVQALAVYGRIPASQAAPTGSYSDTITVTITF